MGHKGCGSGAASLARPGCGFGKANAFPKRGPLVDLPAALPIESLTPLGSSLWKREPVADTFELLMGSVSRIPVAAKPLIASLLPWEGGGAVGDGG